jgi:DNA ligase-1
VRRRAVIAAASLLAALAAAVANAAEPALLTPLRPTTATYTWRVAVPAWTTERQVRRQRVYAPMMRPVRVEYALPEFRSERRVVGIMPEFSCKYPDAALPNACRTTWRRIYAEVPVAVVRRAVTVAGSAAEVAVAALVDGPSTLARFSLQVGTALGPMLARSAPDVATALGQVSPAAVEWKLDGIRVQVHRDGDDVHVFTRSLDDITARVPEVVEAALQLPVRSVVLDGEAIALHADGRPRPFQQTSARVAVQDAARAAGALRQWPLTTFLFDVLHLDGDDLTLQPLRERRRTLEAVAPPSLVVPHLVVDRPDDAAAGVRLAEQFAADAITRGHEGVVVKALDAPYEMGRRGAGWVKVKPVHTFDLVVLAAEWGHGRRTGKLSNLHLGAFDPVGELGPPGGFVMLGKTFKGLTDAVLAWQTQALLALADGPTDHWVVPVRPELVVEVAIDGVQTSPRYPAGIALRFARVVRYRPDKSPQQADTVPALRALLPH